jgi:hypothetical protein
MSYEKPPREELIDRFLDHIEKLLPKDVIELIELEKHLVTIGHYTYEELYDIASAAMNQYYEDQYYKGGGR